MGLLVIIDASPARLFGSLRAAASSKPLAVGDSEKHVELTLPLAHMYDIQDLICSALGTAQEFYEGVDHLVLPYATRGFIQRAASETGHVIVPPEGARRGIFGC